MSHGNYQLITFINEDNTRTATWMGRYTNKLDGSAPQSIEPVVAQQIRNWISTQNIWRINGDVKRNLSNDSLDQFRAQ